MPLNKDISAVFKDFLIIFFFPEKGEGPHFQKNNIVVPRKATNATKTAKTAKNRFSGSEGKIWTSDIVG